MTESENRALARTSAVLLLAAMLRYGLSAREGPPVVHPDSATSLSRLLVDTEQDRDETARRQAPLAPGEKLDPNRASEIEFDRLPGVGPAMARSLVEARAVRPFQRPEDLLAIRGIGPATLERIAVFLDFSKAPRPASGASGSLLDLNAATAPELERLPGVGPAWAGRILEERTRRGGFRAVDDLRDVSGIGPATLERLRPLVRVR
jgi:competence ComEA-like helix-hairpin-helix protein